MTYKRCDLKEYEFSLSIISYVYGMLDSEKLNKYKDKIKNNFDYDLDNLFSICDKDKFEFELITSGIDMQYEKGRLSSDNKDLKSFIHCLNLALELHEFVDRTTGISLDVDELDSLLVWGLDGCESLLLETYNDLDKTIESIDKFKTLLPIIKEVCDEYKLIK